MLRNLVPFDGPCMCWSPDEGIFVFPLGPVYSTSWAGAHSVLENAWRVVGDVIWRACSGAANLVVSRLWTSDRT
jgi:hypothetical protein